MSRCTLLLLATGTALLLGHGLCLNVYNHLVLPAYGRAAAQTFAAERKQAQFERTELEAELQRWVEQDSARRTGWIAPNRNGAAQPSEASATGC